MMFREFVYAASLSLVVLFVGGIVMAAQDKPCYEIVNFEKTDGRPGQYLINKCTGENWTALRQKIKDPDTKEESHSWGWYRVNVYDNNNQAVHD